MSGLVRRSCFDHDLIHAGLGQQRGPCRYVVRGRLSLRCGWMQARKAQCANCLAREDWIRAAGKFFEHIALLFGDGRESDDRFRPHGVSLIHIARRCRELRGRLAMLPGGARMNRALCESSRR